MAKRLIDQAALIEDIEAAEKNAGMGAVVAGTLKRYVKRQPTVDAVEVCYCKDCKHMEIAMGKLRWCNAWNAINGMGDYGYCNYGERKEE